MILLMKYLAGRKWHKNHLGEILCLHCCTHFLRWFNTGLNDMVAEATQLSGLLLCYLNMTSWCSPSFCGRPLSTPSMLTYKLRAGYLLNKIFGESLSKYQFSWLFLKMWFGRPEDDILICAQSRINCRYHKFPRTSPVKLWMPQHYWGDLGISSS